MEWSPALKQEWLEACHRLQLFPAWEDAALLELLATYGKLYDALIVYNQKVNLTRITEPRDVLYRHLLDSLLLVPHIPQGAHVADVGSGAGFPAIPLAMARPDLQVTAMESVGKKCVFIEEIRQAFGLEDRLKVVNGRSEELGNQPLYREQFDVVTARAVAALPTLLELTLPLTKPKGSFIAIKGPSYEEELKASQKALQTLKGRCEQVIHSAVSPEQASILLIFQKTGVTPKGYPRLPGMPSKKPL